MKEFIMLRKPATKHNNTCSMCLRKTEARRINLMDGLALCGACEYWLKKTVGNKIVWWIAEREKMDKQLKAEGVHV